MIAVTGLQPRTIVKTDPHTHTALLQPPIVIMPDSRDEPVPAISITESSSSLAVSSATTTTPPSSPRNRLSTAARLREKLENEDAKRAESPSTVQDRLLNLCVNRVLCP